MARVTLMLELLVLLAVGTDCREALLDACDIGMVENNEATDSKGVETNFTGDSIKVHLSPQPGSSHLLEGLQFIIRTEQENVTVHVINSSYVVCEKTPTEDSEPKTLRESFTVTENSERWWRDVEVRMEEKKVVIGGVEVCEMKGKEMKTLRIATVKEGRRLAAFNCDHGCLELNSDNNISQLLLPNQAIYLKAERLSKENGTAILDWKTDDDSYNGTMNLSINPTEGWQELKMSSYDIDGQNLTVTVVHMKDRILEVFRGDTVNGKGDTEGGDGNKGQSKDKITGQLQVRTSANLVWALGCDPHTATSVETPYATTPGLPPGTSTAPPITPSAPASTPSTPVSTPTSTPASTPTSAPASTPLTDSSTMVWKTLAIIALVLLLVTLLFVIYHCVNRVQNGGATVDRMESGLLSGSKSSLVNSNSESCRPRFPSNASAKRETGNLGMNALTTQSEGPGLPQAPTSLPPLPQSPSPQPPMPSYVLPNPLQMALSMNQDNDDESEHDYDYLDLNLLKIQIEKNKVEEEKKRKEQEQGLTRHDSENSLYEAFSTPAEDDTKYEDKERNEDQEERKEEKGGLAGHDDNTDGSKDKKQEDEEVKGNSDGNEQKGDGKRVDDDDDDAESENEDKESESEDEEGEDGVGESEDAGESEGDGERKKEDGVGESESDGERKQEDAEESESDGERKKEDEVEEKETEDSKL